MEISRDGDKVSLGMGDPMVTEPRRGLAVGILLFAAFMDLLDVTIVQVALPAIGADLEAPGDSLEWVVSGYLLAFAVALVTGGRLGDIAGRRRMFLVGVGGFTAASCLCAASWTVDVLVAARVLQGLFAAVMVPQLLATVQSLFAPRERAPWYGVIGAVTGLAAVIGPVLGGTLVDADLWGLGWRTIFLINAPVGVVILALTSVLVPETRSQHPLGVDLPGVLVLSAALLCLLVPLVEGRTLGWPVWLLVSVAAGVVLLAVFVRHCLRRQVRDGSAVLPLTLFRNRGFSAGVVTQAGFQAAMNAFTLPFLFYLQLSLGRSALGAALNLLAFSVGSMLATGAVVPLVARLGRNLVTIGAVLMAAGFLWTYATLAAEGAAYTARDGILPMALAGIGLAAVVVPLVDVALAAVPVDDAGAASGTLSTFQQLGAAVGVAVSMTVFLGAVGADWTAANTVAALRASVVVSGVGLGVVVLASRALPRAQAVRAAQRAREQAEEAEAAVLAGSPERGRA